MTSFETLIESAMLPLESAKSLPFSAYTDRDVLSLEVDSIFSKEWVFVCMAGEIPNPGDYFVLSIVREPVIVIRGDDGELRALSNICRHRGTTILDEGFGTAEKYLTCPYHAWSYSKQGDLKAVPYNKVIAVDRDEHHLPSFSLSIWNGLVFVNLDPAAPPLSERLHGIDSYLTRFEPETFDQVSQGEVEVWQSNWKLAMENAMESYHLFKVHEETLELYSPTRDAYYIAGSSEWTLTGGATKRKKGLIESLLGSSYDKLYDHYILISLPPSFVGILSYGTLGWLSAHPVDEATTQIRSGATFIGNGMEGSAQADDFTKAFFQEDKDMCERVQKGMYSKHSRGGKLVDMERVVVDFHQFIGTRLGALSRTEMFESEGSPQPRELNS